jgi:hypothetical protein
MMTKNEAGCYCEKVKPITDVATEAYGLQVCRDHAQEMLADRLGRKPSRKERTILDRCLEALGVADQNPLQPVEVKLPDGTLIPVEVGQ